MRSNARNNRNKTGIQTKLNVSQPGDVYEQEADRRADQVMRMSASSDIGIPFTREEERLDRKSSACAIRKGKEDRKEGNLVIRRKPSASKLCNEIAIGSGESLEYLLVGK